MNVPGMNGGTAETPWPLAEWPATASFHIFSAAAVYGIPILY